MSIGKGGEEHQGCLSQLALLDWLFWTGSFDQLLCKSLTDILLRECMIPPRGMVRNTCSSVGYGEVILSAKTGFKS